MELDSARELKEGLMTRLVVPLAVAANVRAARSTARGVARVGPSAMAGGGSLEEGGSRDFAIAAQAIEKVPEQQRTIALGIAPHHERRGQYRLAIRVQRQALLQSHYVEEMIKRAKGDADVRHIGRVVKRPGKRPVSKGAASAGGSGALWYRSVCRPLQIGASIGHHRVTAGTLGCFVRDKTNQVLVLSNNHVLANEGLCAVGDTILQPGRYDGGRLPKGRSGELASWIKLKKRSPNLVDCAVATIESGIKWTPSLLLGVGGGTPNLAGVSPPLALDEGITVYKVGRTTGATVGRVTAFELDNVVVNYDVGNLRFDSQIEIEGVGNAPFSDGGDSGSLIVDTNFRALALLFAGADIGGTNGLGLTYANPIETVLAHLKVSLLY